MAGTSIDDLIVAWGLQQTPALSSYDEAKRALIAGRTPNQLIAAAGGGSSMTVNEALLILADVPEVLREAVLWLDSQYSVTGEPRVINRGTGGSALDAKYGSVLGAYVYDGAAVLPGVNGNYLSVPDEAAFDFAGDFTLVAKLSLNDVTPAAISTVGGNARSGGAGWSLQINTTGSVYVVWSSVRFAESTATLASAGITDGQTFWLAATLDAEAISSNVARFWTSTDGVVWTQLGADVSVAGGLPSASVDPVGIGQRTFTADRLLNGSVSRFIARNGIEASGLPTGGTTVLDVDLSSVDDYATSFTATTGQTVTVNSTSSDTNDPLLLTHTGENYVYSPGASGNYLSVPDEAALDITGDIDIATRFSVPSWPGAADFYFSSKYLPSNLSWQFALSAGTRRPRFVYTANGSTLILVNSSITPTWATTNTDLWIRVTRNATTGDVSFYWAPGSVDYPSSWTLHETVAGASGAMFSGTGVLYPCFFSGGSSYQEGNFYRTVIKDGIDGTTVFDFNAATDITDAGATSFTASSGQTVTVNRATSGRKTVLVTRPVWLFGTDDYLEVADNALLDFTNTAPITVMAVFRQWGTPKNYGRYLTKAEGGVSPGWALNNDTTSQNVYFSQNDGVSQAPSGTRNTVAGQLTTTLGGYRATDDRVWVNVNDGTEAALTKTLTQSHETAAPLGIGARLFVAGSADSFQDFECIAVGVWRRELTTDEIAAINTYYGTGA